MLGKGKSLSAILAIAFLCFNYYPARANPKIVNNIEVKGGPLGLAVDEKNGRLFVLNHRDSTLSVINEKDLNLVKAIPLNRSVVLSMGNRSVAYDPIVNYIYITTGHEIFLVDGSIYTYKILLEINSKKFQRFISELAVINDQLYLLDLYGHIYSYTQKGDVGSTIEVKDSGDIFMSIGPLDRFYLSSAAKGLIVVDRKAGKVVTTVPVTAFSIPESSLNTVYVAGPGKLYMIDAKTLKVKKTIDVDYPQIGGLGMALNPNTGHLFLVTAEDTVTVIDTAKGKKVDKLKVCSGPKSIAINKETNTVYVACPDSDTITVIKDN